MYISIYLLLNGSGMLFSYVAPSFLRYSRACYAPTASARPAARSTLCITYSVFNMVPLEHQMVGSAATCNLESTTDFFSFGKSHPCPFGPRVHIYSITYIHHSCSYVDSKHKTPFLTETRPRQLVVGASSSGAIGSDITISQLFRGRNTRVRTTQTRRYHGNKLNDLGVLIGR